MNSTRRGFLSAFTGWVRSWDNLSQLLQVPAES
jgi:hypothetical protein